MKHAQAWPAQGWVSAWEDGHQGEKNSRVKHALAWSAQEWVTRCEEGCWSEMNSRVKGAQVGQSRNVDLRGLKKRVLYRFINLCNFKKKQRILI